MSKDASLLEVNDVEFDKINRLTQRKYHHGQMNQELQKLKELHESMFKWSFVRVIISLLGQSEKLRKKHLKEIEDLMSTMQTVQKIEFPKLLIRMTGCDFFPFIPSDDVAHSAAGGRGLCGRACLPSQHVLPLHLRQGAAHAGLRGATQPAPQPRQEGAAGRRYDPCLLIPRSRLAVVTDALIFAMHTGGPKEEFDALLNNATLTQLNSLSSKGTIPRENFPFC